MKTSQIRTMTDDEVARTLDETYQELFNLRFQYATGQLRNVARLSQVKRDIARLRTILRERELAAWYQSAATEG